MTTPCIIYGCIHDKGHQFGGRPIPHEPLLNGVSSKTIYKYRPDHGFVLARVYTAPMCKREKLWARSGEQPTHHRKGAAEAECCKADDVV